MEEDEHLGVGEIRHQAYVWLPRREKGCARAWRFGILPKYFELK